MLRGYMIAETSSDQRELPHLLKSVHRNAHDLGLRALLTAHVTGGPHVRARSGAQETAVV